MHIIYFHQYFSTPSGKTGTRSYEFAKELISSGHKVTMVCGRPEIGDTGLKGPVIDGYRKGVVDGINVIEINLPYSNHLNLIQRSIVFIKFALKSILVAYKTDYDILYATSTPLTISIPGIVMRVLKPSKKFLFEVRDLWPELPKEMGLLKNPIIYWSLFILERLSYFFMHKGIALSPGIKDGMIKGAKNKEIALIPNGCDLDLFYPETKVNKNSKKIIPSITPKVLPSDFVAVFTGAHGIANGLDAVLDAAICLKDSPNIKLLFVGDGKLKPHLIERAKKEKLENCVFINPLPKLELAKLMQEVDIGMMILSNVPAFYYGTSPNKFFDYISLGLPVINNYPGWVKDMLEEFNCGVPVTPNQPKELAEAIKKLANDDLLRIKMGKNSRKLAENRFNRSMLAKQMVKLVDGLNA